MRVLILLLVFQLGLMAQWPPADKIKIVVSSQASAQEKKLADQMVDFFAQGNQLLAEDMIVNDLYAEKFFTYFTHNFLVIVGINNRLQKMNKRGVQVHGVAPFYTEQGSFDEEVAYAGLVGNPLFLKARFVGAVKGPIPSSLVISGTNEQMLKHCWSQVKKGWLQGTWTKSDKAVEMPGSDLWGQIQVRDQAHKKGDKDVIVRKYLMRGRKYDFSLWRADQLGRLSKLD